MQDLDKLKIKKDSNEQSDEKSQTSKKDVEDCNQSKIEKTSKKIFSFDDENSKTSNDINALNQSLEQNKNESELRHNSYHSRLERSSVNPSSKEKDKEQTQNSFKLRNDISRENEDNDRSYHSKLLFELRNDISRKNEDNDQFNNSRLENSTLDPLSKEKEKEQTINSFGQRNDISRENEDNDQSPSKISRKIEKSQNSSEVKNDLLSNNEYDQNSFELINELSREHEDDQAHTKISKNIESNPKQQQKSANIGSIRDFATVDEESFLHYSNQLSSWKGQAGIYVDPDFPQTFSSLNLKDLSKFNNREIIWSRPNTFLEKNLLTIFDKINSLDVLQGSLGNCYFLAALCALTSKPALISRLFQTTEINEYGFYCIWLCIFGRWQLTTLNDYFPIFKDNNSPLFSKPNHDKIWVLLLEKAYAKIYKSYSNIECGSCLESFRDLTGAPTKLFKLNDLNKEKMMNKTDIWKHLLRNHEKGYLMTTSTTVNNKYVSKGIVLSHAYTILDIQEFEEIKLIRLRNPWGSNNYVGEWNNDSSRWSDFLKSKLNFKLEENGMFYINFEEFIQSFESINICKVHENFYYSSKFYSLSTNPKHLILKFYFDSNIEVYFTVSQKDKRNYSENSSYEYKPCSMLLYNAQSYELMVDNYGQERDLSLHFKGKKGNYKLYIDFYNYEGLQLGDDDSIAISFYGEKKIDFEGFTYSNGFEELAKIIKANAERNNKTCVLENYEVDKDFDGLIQRYQNFINLYNFFFYKNTTSNTNLKEELTIREILGQNSIYPQIKPMKSNEKFFIDLNPNETHLIVFKTFYDKGINRKMNYITEHGISIEYKFEYLIDLLRREGGKKEYIVGKFLCYSLSKIDWYFSLYENLNVSDLKIQINLLQLQNLECVTHIINKDYEIHINLKSNEHRLVAFRKKNKYLGWKYHSDIIY